MNNNETGYYELLGVTNQSTQNEIKQAFRKLSLLHHPDRNGGNDVEFKKINEAYETLSDTQKRKLYDISLQNPFLQGNVMEVPIDAASLFSMMFAQELGKDPDIHVFQGAFPMGGGNMPFKRSEPEPEPIVKTMHITMQEAYTGCCKPLEIERWKMHFNRQVRENETIYVDIPQGIGNNESIILQGKGNMISKSVIGDIKIMIQLANSSDNMTKDGLDIIYKHNITLKESLCGFSFSLNHINGKQFKINNAKGNIISPGFKKIVPGYGFIRNEHQGNLIIEFTIQFPEKLTDKQISSIENNF